jgi:hypothetical protein
MRKIMSMSLAFGTLLIAAGPAGAATQQANTISREVGTLERQRSTARIGDDALGAYARSEKSPRQICTYIGGPKGTLWACR